MASVSEVGHAKNLANFEKLISVCTSYGTAYNPSKAGIKLTALVAQATATRTSFDTFNIAKRASDAAITSRQVAFAPIKKLCTRIVNALSATDSRKQVKEDANGLNKKIQGTSISAAAAAKASAKVASPTEPGDPTPTPAPKTISTSQQSFDSVVENFSKLVVLLQSEPLYVPNEADLKVTALTTLLGTLRASNKAVNDTLNATEKARIARDKNLYLPDTGICDIASAVKDYVLSVYTATAREYKQVKSIPFKNQDV